MSDRCGKTWKWLIRPLPLGFLLSMWPAVTAMHAQTLGVRHRVDAIVTVEADSPLIKDNPGANGTLSLTVRLSANSMEARFFGMLSPSFSGIVIPDKVAPLVAQTRIWEEKECHQRRGLPKVTVTSLKGSFGEEKSRLEIDALVRRIGLRVPSDELTPGIKLPSGTDDIGSFYAWRAQTRNTRLDVDLKIYAFACFLKGP